MNKLKQCLSLFLSIAILLTVAFSTTVYAVNNFEISLTESVGAPAEEVSLNIVLKGNPGFNALNIALSYNDEYFQLKNIENKVSSLYMSKGSSIVWDGAENHAEDGVLATVTFAIADNAPAGEYEIKLIFWGASNEDFEEVSANAISGKITVTCPHANTTNVPEDPADCDEGGYTAGVWCNDCETYIGGHEPISATGNHTDADGKWESDEVNHFRTCDCGHIFDTDTHSGGTASCKEKAKCSVCGTEYGQLNAANHAGGTTTVNASEPNHKTQQAGYTGDTKCLGCGEIIAYGQPIEPGAHTPADVWSNDETHHWKECNVVGCGVVIDGSKATHTSTGTNVATCQKQAVCDVCGVSYGTVASHNYTAEEKKQDALKTAGNCRDHAVYYYSCSVCGLVENDDSHTFLGDKVATSHIGGTTVVNASEANHKTQTNGYTGDTKCLGCNEIIAYGQAIPAGAHTPASNWTTDGTYHWKVCTVADCGIVTEGTKAAHTATGTNVATCKTQAICDVCETAHGSLNASNHAGGTTIVNAAESDHKTQTAGYTGDTKCLGCGEIINYGQPIEPGAHTPADIWSNDETHHWKECNVVGCGVVIDGSKATHTSTGANVATCQKQAVCDVCGVSYGSVAEHNYTAEDKKQTALKTEGNCRDNAVYYYSCSVCGLVENNDNHTFLGDKVATTHVGGTTTVNASVADHKTQTNGYTGDTKCLGCNEIIAYGQAIPAGAHNPAIAWTTDETHHWKECTVVGCGVVIDGSKAAHASTGANVATCQKQAVCDICGVSYGAVADHDFANTLSKDASGHWYACQTAGCTGKDGFAQHTPDHDGGATEDYAIKCTVCLYEIEAQLGHTHVFNKEVVDIRYEASKASCSAAATYYFSCKCGEKGTATFSYGEPNEHTEGISWKSDETHHWKECSIVGCGVVIDGSKAAHTSTGANVATCQKQAICDICDVSYGTVADHDFADTLSKDATGHWYACQTTGCTEKNGFVQHTPDHDGGATEEYPIKCTVCQYEIEAQLGHTHVFDKEVAEDQYLAGKANCTDPAKYYKSCKCGEKGTETFTSGEKLGHTEGTAWEKDATGHWHTCTVAGCGVMIDTSKAEHTPDREAATETDPIKCSVCGYEIAPVMTHTHMHSSEWKSDKDNHWNECVCGDKANTAAHKDENTDGKCDTCEYVVSVPDNDNPQTGDNSMISLWIILLCISGLGIVVTTVCRKKRMF